MEEQKIIDELQSQIKGQDAKIQGQISEISL